MPDKLRQYISLCRLDRPTGIWLLLWPCLWAILLSSTSPTVALKLMVLFAAGAVFMRSAGCIINDIIDRKLDRQVARTRSRPLASGAISIKEAVTLCLFLLLLAFGILLLLNRLAIIIGVLSLIPIALYPYMKRWTKWPQAFLGLTFNIGALMGWAASTGEVPMESGLLFAACFFWTLGYDTIYAHQDMEDDLKVGIHSTAITWGQHSRVMIYSCYLLMLLLLVIIGVRMEMLWSYHLMLGVLFLVFTHQVLRTNLTDPADCLRQFKLQNHIGWVYLLGIAMGKGLI